MYIVFVFDNAHIKNRPCYVLYNGI